ncbi:hypothetical protein F3157_08065 [Virgibacillus dakarensis]|nr:hypothetical protein [Virgibacillus dakarensis]
MNSEQLLNVTKAMKLEILNILINSDLSNNKQAQKALLTINDMFKRLDQSVEDVIPQETLNAYFSGVDEATKALNKVGINPVNGLAASISSTGTVAGAFATHVHMNAVSEITDNTMLDLKAAIRTARQNTYFTLMTTLQGVKEDLQSGIIRGMSRKVITQRVAESFAKDGMTAFITVDGKQLPLDFYSQVVTRTNLKQANTNGAINRYKENGQDLVKISGNTPTCYECHAYRGMVFSLSGEDDRFPPAAGNLPPYHAQCQCSASVYVAEFKSDKEVNKEVERAKTFDPTKDTRSESQKKAYEKQQRLNRQNNYEKKRYADIKGVLGDDAPANLGAFKRMKRANTDNYNKLIQDYQDALKSIKK